MSDHERPEGPYEGGYWFSPEARAKSEEFQRRFHRMTMNHAKKMTPEYARLFMVEYMRTWLRLGPWEDDMTTSLHKRDVTYLLTLASRAAQD